MGASLSHLDGTGSQLLKAAKSGDADTVTVLLRARPHALRYATMRQFNACHYAAQADHTEVLQQLFNKAEEIEFIVQLTQGKRVKPPLVQQLVNSFSDRGVTPLMLAADRGCVASVKLLLAKGADPWAVDKLGGRSALHYAAQHDNVEVVQALLEAAGEGSGPVRFPNRPNTRYVDLRTQSGFTASHFAVHANAQQALAVLLNSGANPMLSSLFDCLDCINCPRGSTPLHLAARRGNMETSKQLLKAYVEQWHHRNMPDPRLVMDGDDNLPCQVAARRQHAALARMLLPSAPLATLLADGQLITQLGPPSLALIAGGVVRGMITRELDGIEGDEPAAAQAAAGAGAGAELEGQEGGSATPASDCCSSVTDACQQQQQQGPARELPEGVVPTCQLGAAEEEEDIAEDCASSGSSTNSVELCGVCFDMLPQVTLSPCRHQLCVSCCRHLLAMDSRCVLMCPFCRSGVGHLAAAAAPAEEAANVVEV